MSLTGGNATDVRIVRTLMNVVICRTFGRSVLLATITRGRIVIDRFHKYRPRIDRLEMGSFAGLSCSLRSLRSVFRGNLTLLLAFSRD